MELRSANVRNMRFEPISFSEILAWRDLTRVNILPWEVDMIRLLDNEWMDCQPKDA